MKTLLLAGLTGLVVAATSLTFAQVPDEEPQDAEYVDDSQADATPQSAEEVPQDDAEAYDDDFGLPVIDYASLPFRDLRRVAPVTGDAAAGQAISEPCAACHGEQGISPIPAMPHLAGQTATYLYEATRLYHDGYLPDTPMSTLADGLSDDDMRNLAVFYAAQPRKGVAAPVERLDDEITEESALPPPTPDMLAHGERLYLHGDSARAIPSCQGCHGADALGHPMREMVDRSGHVPYALYPALRGQDRESLLFRMHYYQAQPLGKVTSHHVMVPVAKQLHDNDVQAVAAWLSSLQD